MTTIQLHDFDGFVRALQRAQAHQIHVSGFAVSRDYDAFYVVNPARGDGYYTVRLGQESGLLTCNCVCGQVHGSTGWCQHRAAVVAWIIGNW